MARLGRPAFRGPLGNNEQQRRTVTATQIEALFRNIVARRILRDTRGGLLLERVALLDMLGLLPADWPREGDGRGDRRPWVPCTEAEWRAATSVDDAAWFRDTLVPCSGQVFREKWAQNVRENPGRKRPPGD